MEIQPICLARRSGVCYTPDRRANGKIGSETERDLDMSMFVFTGIILRDGDGFSALCPELDVASQGDSPEEARTMLLEAATLHLEGAFEDGLPYSRPLPAEEDPRQASPEEIVEVFRFKVDVKVRAYA